MRQRFRLYRRGKVFWCQDNETNRQESLGTKDRGGARALLQAHNDVYRQPALNLQLARVYLQHDDPQMAERTWLSVMTAIVNTKNDTTKDHWLAATKDRALAPVRDRKLLETTAEHFLRALESGTVSTNVFLRRIHNFALDMNWLAAPIIPKRQWPPVKHKEKRAITSEEHRRASPLLVGWLARAVRPPPEHSFNIHGPAVEVWISASSHERTEPYPIPILTGLHPH